MAAGKNPPMLHKDPAYIKWNHMHNQRYRYFKWTPRTVWISLCYVVIVPSIIGTMGYMTEGKYEYRGKRRGDLLVEY